MSNGLPLRLFVTHSRCHRRGPHGRRWGLGGQPFKDPPLSEKGWVTRRCSGWPVDTSWKVHAQVRNVSPPAQASNTTQAANGKTPQTIRITIAGAWPPPRVLVTHESRRIHQKRYLQGVTLSQPIATHMALASTNLESKTCYKETR